MRALSYYNGTESQKGIIADAVWKWYANNKDVKITTIKLWWIIRRTLYVRDLYDALVWLFGPPAFPID